MRDPKTGRFQRDSRSARQIREDHIREMHRRLIVGLHMLPKWREMDGR